MSLQIGAAIGDGLRRAILSMLGASILVDLAVTVGFVSLFVPGLFLMVSFVFAIYAVGVEVVYFAILSVVVIVANGIVADAYVQLRDEDAGGSRGTETSEAPGAAV